jgi:hypothetical protein
MLFVLGGGPRLELLISYTRLGNLLGLLTQFRRFSAESQTP